MNNNNQLAADIGAIRAEPTVERLIRANEIQALFHKQVELGATDLVAAFEDALMDAQSIELPARPQAHWVVDDTDFGEPGYCAAYIEVHCSNCGSAYGAESGQYGWYWGDPFPMHFCPHCGAKMDLS